MVKKKNVRQQGKIQLSEYFKKLKRGEKVAIIREKSIDAKFPKRMQGRTGKVGEQRGNSYVVEVKDSNKPKKFIIKPIHLRRLK